jgi:pimeloyl-ACP methyl ester carboxylesterase
LRFARAFVAFMFMAMRPAGDDFNSGGVNIHYAVHGFGDPLILIHGLYSNGWLNWDFPGTTALLAKHFEVITLDCRGHGRSGKPTADDAYGINMVEDVVRLMDHLNIRTARVAGYSMGGMITMKLAVTHPERVSAAVLGGMGWLKAGTQLSSVWDKLERPLYTVPPACAKSFPQFGVTEAEIKAVKILVTILVGEHDPCRQWYVEPLHALRPEWPVHVIVGADHLNCTTTSQFRMQLEAALGK